MEEVKKIKGALLILENRFHNTSHIEDERTKTISVSEL